MLKFFFVLFKIVVNLIKGLFKKKEVIVQETFPTEKIQEFFENEIANITCLFPFRIGTEEDKEEIYQRVLAEYRDIFQKEFGRIWNSSFFRKFCSAIEEKAARKFVESMGGVTLREEVEGEDCIIMFPNNLSKQYSSIKAQLKDEWSDDAFEEICRSFIRHENRHAEQFIEMRKLGILEKVLEAERYIPMLKRVTELDAYGGQYKGYPPISEFIERVKTEIK